MASTEIVSPSVGGAPTGKSESSGSRPSGGAGEIFDAIQRKLNVPAEAPKKPEELAKKEEVVAPAPKPGSTEAALADAGKAPETPAKAEDEKKDEKPKKPSIRSIIKASNIPADDKDPITNLAYMGHALHELGVTPDVVKMFQEQGVTPATIDERIKLHPTVADAQRDAWFASEMRRVANDYTVDPQKFLLGLKQSAIKTPGTFKALIEVASTYLKEESRPTWTAMLSDGFKNALYNLGQEALSGGDEETQAAVAIVQSKFGFAAQQAAQAAQAEDPAFAALRQRNAELEGRQQQEAEASKAAFLESVVTESRNVVYGEIDKRWRKSAVAGLTEAETKRAIDDIFYAVEQDLSSVENFVYDMNAKRHGPLTQQAYREAVQYAFDRALPFIPKHQKTALEFWTPRALAQAQNRDLTEKKAASQVDAAAVGGSAPAPAGNTPKSKLDELRGRKDLTFREKVAASFSR